MKKRPLLTATIAVVLAGAAGASAVFLAGSKQRRDDRNALVAYERVLSAPVAEVLLISREMRSGIGGAAAVDRWRRRLADARSAIAAAEAPSFLRGLEARWLAALDAYMSVTDEHTGGSSVAVVLRKADDLFGRAASTLAFHHRRLGLGATLPAPAATRSS